MYVRRMSLTAVLLKQSGDIETIVIGGRSPAGKGKKAAAAAA